MKIIDARNVNDAYRLGRLLLLREGVASESRAGPVWAAPYPVVTTYQRPLERVLFDPGRDANPFFHFFEALWMLAGWNDGTWLDRFVGDFSKRFGEDRGRIWGAYGFRWRRHFIDEEADESIDQLNYIVERLRADPTDRRVVLTMWDPLYDLWPVEGTPPKDLPCNTHAYPRIVDGSLDLTVCCRSNDVVWGAYGANAVHFSFLLEYLAGRIGVPVGRYYQISNNWHGYVATLDKHPLQFDVSIQHYERGDVQPYPLMVRPDMFDMDLKNFLGSPSDQLIGYHNPFFRDVALPMYVAHSFMKTHGPANLNTRNWLDAIHASDWRLAATEWVGRRAERAQG